MKGLAALAGGLLAGSAAAAPAAAATADPGSSNSRILMAGEGRIMLGTVRASGAGINIKVNHSIKGVPSWVAFRAPDTLFALDEAGTEVRALAVDLDKPAVSEGKAFGGSAGLVHLALTQGGKRMLGTAYGNGSVDVWDVTDKLGPNRQR